MKIAEVTHKDVDQVSKILFEGFLKVSEYFSLDQLRLLLSEVYDSKAFIFLAAKDKGQVLGYVLVLVSPLRALLLLPRLLKFLNKIKRKNGINLQGLRMLPYTPHVLSIAVNRKFRGRGIGTALMKTIFKRLRGRYIFLTYQKDNLPAKKLYDKLKFEFIREMPNLLWENQTWVLVRKVL